MLSQVREEALRQIHQNPEHILAEYNRRFGNVLNADNAAELFPAYTASVESRTRFRVAVHPAAQWVRDELFRRSLTDPNVHQIIFTLQAAMERARPAVGSPETWS